MTERRSARRAGPHGSTRAPQGKPGSADGARPRGCRSGPARRCQAWSASRRSPPTVRLKCWGEGAGTTASATRCAGSASTARGKRERSRRSLVSRRASALRGSALPCGRRAPRTRSQGREYRRSASGSPRVPGRTGTRCRAAGRHRAGTARRQVARPAAGLRACPAAPPSCSYGRYGRARDGKRLRASGVGPGRAGSPVGARLWVMSPRPPPALDSLFWLPIMLWYRKPAGMVSLVVNI